jgi:hypothetical protein
MYSTTCSVLGHAILVVRVPYAFPSIETVIIIGEESVALLHTELVTLVYENPVSSGAAPSESKLY